jgi:hypothetical protein
MLVVAVVELMDQCHKQAVPELVEMVEQWG